MKKLLLTVAVSWLSLTLASVGQSTEERLDNLKQGVALEKDAEGDAKLPPIKDFRDKNERPPLTNLGMTAIERAAADSLKPKSLQDRRGSGQPVMTNMQTYEKTRQGEVRYLMSKGVDLRDAEFVLEFDLPEVPQQDRKIVYSFTPNSRQQKHISTVAHIQGLPSADKVAQLQLCLSQRLINQFTLDYYRQWVEGETKQPVPPTDGVVKDLEKRISDNTACIEKLTDEVTELDVVNSQQKYAPQAVKKNDEPAPDAKNPPPAQPAPQH